MKTIPSVPCLKCGGRFLVKCCHIGCKNMAKHGYCLTCEKPIWFLKGVQILLFCSAEHEQASYNELIPEFKADPFVVWKETIRVSCWAGSETLDKVISFMRAVEERA